MIQRYDLDDYDGIGEDPDGDYVKYVDCAALERKYQALWRECGELAKENKRYKEALERIRDMGTIGIMEIASEALGEPAKS